MPLRYPRYGSGACDPDKECISPCKQYGMSYRHGAWGDRHPQRTTGIPCVSVKNSTDRSVPEIFIIITSPIKNVREKSASFDALIALAALCSV